MTKISNDDRKKILKISKKYLEIHQNIAIVEKKMEDLHNLSAKLLNELDECRSIERSLMCDMEKRYGSGKFNPFDFCWENKI